MLRGRSRYAADTAVDMLGAAASKAGDMALQVTNLFYKQLEDLSLQAEAGRNPDMSTGYAGAGPLSKVCLPEHMTDALLLS